MLTITTIGSDGELQIDYQSGSLGFTVITKDDRQLDFSVSREDWELIKLFIDKQIELSEKQESK